MIMEINNTKKPIKARPSFYAHLFYQMKEIAQKEGYNLVLHGSLNRDLDLILIPWSEKLGQVDDIINEFIKMTGGRLLHQTEQQIKCFPHGRESRVIHLMKGGYWNNWKDEQYYLDISVIPVFTKSKASS